MHLHTHRLLLYVGEVGGEEGHGRSEKTGDKSFCNQKEAPMWSLACNDVLYVRFCVDGVWYFYTGPPVLSLL